MASQFRPQEIAFYTAPKIYEKQPSGQDLLDDYRRVNQQLVPLDGKTVFASGDNISTPDNGDADDIIGAFATDSTDRTAVDGQAGSDYVYGALGLDLLIGGDGDDIIAGSAGSDRLIGGAGADVLSGGSDDDVLTGIGDLQDDLQEGGFQDDILYGGEGGDSFNLSYKQQEYAGVDARAKIMDFDPDEGDRFGLAENLDDDELAVRWNGEATELIDLRGLADEAVSAIASLQNGDSLDSLNNANPINNNVIAEVYSPNGRGEASNFVELFNSNRSQFFAPVSAINSLFQPEAIALYKTPKIYEAQPSGQDLLDDYRRINQQAIPFDEVFPALGETPLTPDTENTDDRIGSPSAELNESVNVDGQGGSDYVTGGAKNDSLVGGDGDDIMAGYDGDDTLIGGAGTDVMSGGAGDDILNAVGNGQIADRPSGFQDDILYGGEGADRFDMLYQQQEYAGRDAKAKIMDFNPEEGDRLGLSENLGNNLFVRWNGEATELIDLRGLSDEEVDAITALENGQLIGSATSSDTLKHSVIAELYSPSGRGDASNFVSSFNAQRSQSPTAMAIPQA